MPSTRVIKVPDVGEGVAEVEELTESITFVGDTPYRSSALRRILSPVSLI
jgi:hypothetical protein